MDYLGRRGFTSYRGEIVTVTDSITRFTLLCMDVLALPSINKPGRLNATYGLRAIGLVQSYFLLKVNDSVP